MFETTPILALMLAAQPAPMCEPGPDLVPEVLVAYDATTLDERSLDDLVEAVEAAGLRVAATHQTHLYDFETNEPPWSYGPGWGLVKIDDGIYSEIPFVAGSVRADATLLFLPWDSYLWETFECDNTIAYPNVWTSAASVIDARKPLRGLVERAVDRWTAKNTIYDIANFEPQACPGDQDGDGKVDTNDLLTAASAGYLEPLLATLENWGGCAEE